MAAFTRFEDIKAWKKAREVTKLVYAITSGAEFGRDYSLIDQIRRSVISVMANIAEGFGRRSDKEFANFLNIARGSVCESESHMYVALDLGYVGQENFDNIYNALEETARMLYNLEKHLRK